MTRKPRARLTGRELELVALLATGTTPKEIAGSLGISVWTVRAHLANARKRTGARTTNELIARAKRRHAPDQIRTAGPSDF